MDERERRRRYTRCSFCGKGQDQVRKLVAGPGVYICDQCITLCNEVLDEDARSGGSKGQWVATTSRVTTRGGFWKRLFGRYLRRAVAT
jgi:hypothetical protein